MELKMQHKIKKTVVDRRETKWPSAVSLLQVRAERGRMMYRVCCSFLKVYYLYCDTHHTTYRKIKKQHYFQRCESGMRAPAASYVPQAVLITFHGILIYRIGREGKPKLNREK